MGRQLQNEVDQDLADAAKRLREQANLLPAGSLRAEVLRKARQAETAANVNAWVASAGLRPPE